MASEILKIVCNTKEFNQQIEEVDAKVHSVSASVENAGKDGKKGAEQIGESVKSSTNKAAKGLNDAKEKSKSLGQQLKDSFAGAWEELSDGEGKAKEAAGVLKGMFSPVGIAVAGIGLAVKLAAEAWDYFTESAEEAAMKADTVAAEATKLREETEKTAETSKTYLERLQELTTGENAATGSRQEAISLLSVLSERYGDLGAKIDSTTGKILNMNEVMDRANKLIREQAMDTMNREITALKRKQEALFIATFAGETSDGAARKKLRVMNQLPLEQQLALAIRERNAASNSKNYEGWQKQVDIISEIKKRTNEMISFRNTGFKNEDDRINAKGSLEKTLQSSKGANRERERQFAQKREDDRAATETNPVRQLFLRQQQVNSERHNISLIDKEISSKKAELSGSKDEITRLNVQIQIAKLNGERQAAVEKLYSHEQQVLAIQRQQSDAKKKMAEASEFELQYQKLLNAGKVEEAAKLKLNYELKQQQLQLTENEKKQELEKRNAIKSLELDRQISESKKELEIQKLILNGKYKEAEALKLNNELKRQGVSASEDQKKKLQEQEEKQKALNLQKNLHAQSLSLKDQAMQRAGYGQQAELEKALRDAEKQKGSPLTNDEKKQVRTLANLQWRMNTDDGPRLGNLDLKTNSLTARGGFASGVVMPEKNRINLEIRNYSKRQFDTLVEIKKVCDQLGKF